MKLCVLLFSLCCTAVGYGQSKNSIVSVMSYNVENLFDNVHDAGKEDWTFLPKSQKQNSEAQNYCKAQKGYYKKECFEVDWSDAALDQKLKGVAGSILQVNGGRGPDIVILPEVENLRVLKILGEKYLQKAGYITAVLIEGDDARGIDIGVLSRFPLAEPPRLHRIQFSDNKPRKTRGILEVPLKLSSSETIYVFGVHFPSQAHPTQERADAINTLDRLMQSKGPQALYVAGGDYNIINTEDQSHQLVRGQLSSKYLVSHVVGCQSCKGSHFFKGTWSFLDVLTFSKAFASKGNSNFVLDVNSIVTPKSGPGQTNKDGTPRRFNYDNNSGITDHLPLYSELVRRPRPE